MNTVKEKIRQPRGVISTGRTREAWDVRKRKGREGVEISYVRREQGVAAVSERSTLKGTHKGSPFLKSLLADQYAHIDGITTSRDDAHFGMCLSARVGLT